MRHNRFGRASSVSREAKGVKGPLTVQVMRPSELRFYVLHLDLANAEIRPNSHVLVALSRKGVRHLSYWFARNF